MAPSPDATKAERRELYARKARYGSLGRRLLRLTSERRFRRMQQRLIGQTRLGGTR